MDNDFLCENCLKLDYRMNTEGLCSMDMLVVCKHEEKPKNIDEALYIYKKFYKSIAVSEVNDE